MGFTHGVDPSGTPICSATTWSELLYAINEKEHYMGYTTETTWPDGVAARPLPTDLVGLPRHTILDSVQTARSRLDTQLLENESAPPPNTTFVYQPLKEFSTWTPYLTFAELFNDALGAGTDWTTATADLDELGQGDITNITEMLSVTTQLKDFRYANTLAEGREYQIFEFTAPGPGHPTTDAIFAQALANGVSFRGLGTSLWAFVTYDAGLDDYLNLFSSFTCFFVEPDAATNPVATTADGAMLLQVGDPGGPFGAKKDLTFFIRDSNATEFAAAVWTPDEAGSVISTAVTGVIFLTYTDTIDALASIAFDGSKTYFRHDSGQTNPFDADPNANQTVWLWDQFGLSGFHIRYRTTNWTFE